MSKWAVALVVAVIAAIVSVPSPIVAAPTSPATMYVYDNPTCDAPGNDSVQERGPRDVAVASKTYDAADDCSRGTLARSIVLAAPVMTTYGYLGTPAERAVPTATTARHAVVADREVSSPERPGVAANSVPTRVARVVPEEFGGAPTLGRPGTPDVFVTAADDLAGISTSSGIAERLTLLGPDGKLIPGPFRVLEFDTPAGMASPIFRTNPGFVGRGRTAGGAREFVIPNYPTDSLRNLTMRTVN